jgi:hypothetical protein
MPRTQLMSLFLPHTFSYIIVPHNEPADICICSIQLSDKSLLRKDEINIMICIENCKHWTHYMHYNKYGDYGDDMIDIYCYNHITSIYKPINNSIIAIPTVYMRINYYNDIKSHYESIASLKCPFNNKKFGLIINKSNLNKNIFKVVETLKNYGRIDHISMYDNTIMHASCYNSVELLEVFSQYKFIICIENSFNDGYVTEKIFNCFLAKVIPIYSGSTMVNKFLNTDSFINVPSDEIDNVDLSIVETLRDNEDKYNEFVNKNKISSTYDDENYMNEMVNVIEYKLKLK